VRTQARRQVRRQPHMSALRISDASQQTNRLAASVIGSGDAVDWEMVNRGAKTAGILRGTLA
jgi:hypothetical protein